MRSEDKVVATRAAKAHARHVARTELRRKERISSNWQKHFKKAMISNRGLDKIHAFLGRGLAVQTVKITKGI